MSATRTHLVRSDDHADRTLGVSLCGRLGVRVTAEAGGADCRACARRADKERTQRESTRGVTLDEALRDIVAAISGPDLPGAEQLSPSTWRAMDCRLGNACTPDAWRDAGCPLHMRRCRCVVCQRDEECFASIARWRADKDRRSRPRHSLPFGSVRAALAFLWHWRTTGATARSSHGSAQSRAEHAVELGCTVQTTRVVREDLTTKRATMAADIERALSRSYSDPATCGDLTRREAMATLLSSVDPGDDEERQAELLGVSVAALRGVRARGRKLLGEDLAAGGYCPEPRKRGRR